MKIHILGIGGTFMAGLARLAKESGLDVVGSDLTIYPPMSTQLESLGVTLYNGFDPANLTKDIDYVVVGNVIKRGNPMMEFIMDNNIPYISGPQWLAEHILKDRWVLGVAGTHGKTTTSSMLAWVLEAAELNPGFLIGGVPENFGVSARFTASPFFVVEADEYDSAFFDKRSKFIHYHPKTLVLNNLEFDHADIFPNLAAVMQAFHFLVRTVPGNGLIIHKKADTDVREVLSQGCWTPTVTVDDEWQAKLLKADGSVFEIYFGGEKVGEVDWALLGKHNVENALACVAAAFHVGVTPDVSAKALCEFKNVKRRLEVKYQKNNITIYDDFAHHPTAIATTLQGLRAHVGAKPRIIAVLEFGSYTMRTGVHTDALPSALSVADAIFCKNSEAFDLMPMVKTFKQPAFLFADVEALIDALSAHVQAGDHVVVMSNAGFGGIHEKLANAINV